MKKYTLLIALTILLILVFSIGIYYQNLKKNSDIDLTKSLNININKIDQHEQ